MASGDMASIDMASIDANDTDFAPPLPKCCEKCTAQMKLLGAFPAIALRVAVKIFRCYVCNNVISEETWACLSRLRSTGEAKVQYKGVEYSVVEAGRPGVWKWQFQIGNEIRSGQTATKLFLMAHRRAQLKINQAHATRRRRTTEGTVLVRA